MDNCKLLLLMGFIFYFGGVSTRLVVADVRQSQPLAVKAEVAQLIEKAKKNDAAAQFDLATVYARGLGVSQNPNEAWQWMQKAAENGHAEAQYWMGYAYFYGYKESQDRIKALLWYQKAAAQSYVEAQYMVAAILDSKKYADIPRNPEDAIQWYSQAANSGHAFAAFRLGCKSYFGEDVAKNTESAMEWFKLAGRKGDPGALEFVQQQDKELLKRRCF